MFDDRYKTIAAPSEGLYKEKGSKFLAFAYPVRTIEEVKGHLEQLRKDYFDARHHCYAYILGPRKDAFRANDDGEPSGTGGRPIHGQLVSADLTDTLIVVVRYFGGILLGRPAWPTPTRPPPATPSTTPPSSKRPSTPATVSALPTRP